MAVGRVDPMLAHQRRRSFLKTVGGLFFCALRLADPWPNRRAWGHRQAEGLPLPDETVTATLQRLFGGRRLVTGAGRIKLDLPIIAEDGGNVAISVESDLPVSGVNPATRIYIIADKNRRPMLAKFSLSRESGAVSIATSIRLATSTDVRAIVEMNDGTLYAVSKHVRVTISGCDLPAAN